MDLKLYRDLDGLTVQFVNGDFERDGGLETAALLSLFCPDFWGNAILSESQRVDSRIEAVKNEFRGNELVRELESAIRGQLAWMTRENIARAVEVEVVPVSIHTLNAVVRLQQPDLEMRYQLNWDATREAA